MKLIIASRTHRDVDADLIQLKPPPNKKPFEKQNLLLTVLPSLSMSVPMLLGFYMINRGRDRPAGGSTYMNMGIITAVGSALIGATVAIINLHKRNENRRYNERLRKRSYREYLQYLKSCFSEHINYVENVLRNEHPAYQELVNIKSDKSGSITCLNDFPAGCVSLSLGSGNKSYVLPIKYDNDYQFTEDKLRNEMDELIGKYSILTRIPICAELIDGDSLSIIAKKLSDYYMIFIMLVGKICLTYSPRKVKVGFDLQSNLYSRASGILKFLPHIVNLDRFEKSVEAEYLIVFTDNDKYCGKIGDTKLIRILMGQEGGNHLLHAAEDGTFYVDKEGKRYTVSLDLIGQSEFEAILRTCCRLRNFDDTDEGGIPRILPILELLQKSDVYKNGDKDDIIGIWQNDDAIYDLTIPIGISQNRSITFLNFHERGDGPHGLIAGMTGSGKSELLMSMILTMSVKYPPWYLAFFLIDYKGGGMAASMEKLPHVLGSISNLSGSDIGRAFLSIRSENERRERLFIKHGVSNILKYQEKYRDGQCSEPLPHIFIIIDEFAQLKMEEPDFMQDMIALSRVGRSLGIHLILCTQKPAGSVDGQIISNSGFQIALKLQDPMDSKEVIRRGDAAYLNNPGRAIIRYGKNDCIETFQAAYSLSPASKSRKRAVIAADYYANPVESAEYKEYSGETSLSYLINRVVDASVKSGVVLKPLWLKELPDELSMRDVLTHNISLPEGFVPIGMWDDPVSVSRGIFGLDINDGNVLICGMPYSGKSVFIETFLQSLLMHIDLPEGKIIGKIYILDWGGGVLSRFGEGYEEIAYLREGDEKKAQDLLDSLLMKSDPGGIVLVIDGIGNLTEQGGYTVQTKVRELLRKSESLNIRVIVCAYEISGREVNKSMQGYFKQLLSLGQQEAYRYSEVLLEPHFKGKTNLCPGRGYTRLDGRIVEFMTGRF